MWTPAPCSSEKKAALSLKMVKRAGLPASGGREELCGIQSHKSRVTTGMPDTRHDMVTPAKEHVAPADGWLAGGSVGLRGRAHTWRLSGCVAREGVPCEDK